MTLRPPGAPPPALCAAPARAQDWPAPFEFPRRDRHGPLALISFRVRADEWGIDAIGREKGEAVQTLLECDTDSTTGGGIPPAAGEMAPASLVGRAVRIAGEIFCHQDLYVDGEVDGQLELTDHKLTIGPLARVKANIKAQNVVVVGRAEGNIQASQRVELCSQCSLVGDIRTPRIVIKDGAHFHGTIDTGVPVSAEPAAALALLA